MGWWWWSISLVTYFLMVQKKKFIVLYPRLLLAFDYFKITHTHRLGQEMSVVPIWSASLWLLCIKNLKTFKIANAKSQLPGCWYYTGFKGHFQGRSNLFLSVLLCCYCNSTSAKVLTICDRLEHTEVHNCCNFKDSGVI